MDKKMLNNILIVEKDIEQINIVKKTQTNILKYFLVKDNKSKINSG